MSTELLSDVTPEIAISWPKELYVGGGMCAGVVRSRDAFRSFTRDHEEGTVYSVGQPAHNPHVNQEFIDMGVTFVESVDEVPQGGNVMIGPHGHTAEDEAKSEALGGDYMLTECPLVTKVKNEIVENTEKGLVTIYYGQLLKDEDGNIKPHPETRAAMSAGDVRLVTSLEEALSDDLYEQIDNPDKVAFACQTTHDAEEAALIAEKLKKELFPNIKIPTKPDYCFATHDRQETVKKANKELKVDRVIVLGDLETSSNTRNLAKVAEKDLKEGGRVIVANGFEELIDEDFYGTESVAIIGSASTPMEQIQLVVDSFIAKGSVNAQKIDVRDESRIRFPLPVVHKPFVPEIIWTDK